MGVSNVIQIHIKTGNAAFQEWQQGEVARILRALAERILVAGIPKVGDDYALVDLNGNNIGACRTEEGI